MASRFKCPLQTMADAKVWASEIDQMTEDEFESLLQKWRRHQVGDLHPNVVEYRSVCVEAFELAGGFSLSSKQQYPIDVEVGLASYQYLCSKGFTVVDAANDDIWRYLSTQVLPDLTYFRYPKPEEQTEKENCRINRKRFFSHTRRIWIKTLWWYVYLSWQGDAESTRAVIEQNGANIISHFIERPGKGYRVDLYRQLMKFYSELPNKKDRIFKSVAKLNGAECRNIEPALMQGGIEEYCRILFSKAHADEVHND